jgi:hypothetical protein
MTMKQLMEEIWQLKLICDPLRPAKWYDESLDKPGKSGWNMWAFYRLGIARDECDVI